MHPDADQSDLVPSLFAGARMALHIFGLTRLDGTGYTRTRRRPRRHSANSARGGDWRRIIFANRVAIATTSPVFGRLQSQTYPDQVRALLFVDSFPVEIRTLMGADWPAYPSC